MTKREARQAIRRLSEQMYYEFLTRVINAANPPFWY